jgi:chromosomal replication initiator protein
LQSKHEALAVGGDGRSPDHLSVESDVPTQWARVRAQLREEFGEAAFRSWLRAMTLFEIVEGRVRIGAPTRFLRDWVAAHYSERIRALWSIENPAIVAVEFLVGASPNGDAKRTADCGTLASSTSRLLGPLAPPLASPALPRRPAIQARAPQGDEPVAAEPSDDKTDMSAPLDPRFTFENFVVGKPNELAHAAARRVAESCVATQRTVPFNPLFLYGGVGLGKTHLMHAIAWHLRTQNPARKVIYLSAEKFMYQFIRALRFKDTMAFKEQFRSVDVLMIDDVQFISGKDSTQEEFFHTFNALVDQNRQIIISADKSPSDLEGMEERMRSRLGWGLVADIHPTTYELRLGILQAKAEQRKEAIPPKVLEFLAHKITSNVRELEGALNRILAHSQLIGRDITLESAQEVLHDLLRANDRRVTIDEIQKRVAEHYNIRLADMHSARRARAVARPRQVAMFLCKQLTPRSLPEIGRKFGGRDHTTVMHAVKKIEELRATDRALAEDVELLRRMLET